VKVRLLDTWPRATYAASDVDGVWVRGEVRTVPAATGARLLDQMPEYFSEVKAPARAKAKPRRRTKGP